MPLGREPSFIINNDSSNNNNNNSNLYLTYSAYLQRNIQAPLPPQQSFVRPSSWTYQTPTNYRTYSPVVNRYDTRGYLLPDSQRVCAIPATQPGFLMPDAPQFCQVPQQSCVPPPVVQRECQMPVNQQPVCSVPVSQQPACNLPTSQPVCQVQVPQQGLCPDPQPVCRMPVNQAVCQLPVNQPVFQLPVTQPYSATNRPPLARYNQPYKPKQQQPTAFGINSVDKPSGRPASQNSPDIIPWKSRTPDLGPTKSNWAPPPSAQSYPKYLDVTLPVMVNRSQIPALV